MAILEIENGPTFIGNFFGKEKDVSGELVFQTGITGYPETLTDPSYAKQIIVFTTPLINNYSFPNNKYNNYNININLENDMSFVSALVVSEYTIHYNHIESTALHKWCEENDIVGISGIDTRELTLYIREHGDCKARIYRHDRKMKINYIDISKLDLVNMVSIKEPIFYDNKSDVTILFFDCGAKNSQLINLLNRSINIYRVPYNFKISKEELYKYNGIFISNGPGNPENNKTLINLIRRCINDQLNIPIFGICLGHQILSMAANLDIYKMKYGNRGQNIPVLYHHKVNDNSESIRCFITSQNHGYCVSNDSIIKSNDWNILFTNANDTTNEGIIHKTLPYFSCQFHPEASPGPDDTNFLFDVFTKIILNNSLNLPNNSIKSIINETINLNEDNNLYINRFSINWSNKKVLILGSGGLSIGQAGEFDYSGSQAIKAYNEIGLETILINPNIATIQTNKGLANKIYYNPINTNFVEQILETNNIDYLSASFGGQTALNCAIELNTKGILDKYNVSVLGTALNYVNISEDRSLFKKALNEIGIETPPSSCIKDITSALNIANRIGYPVLIRAGFCLGGLGSAFVHDDTELKTVVTKALQLSEYVIIDKSLNGWKEIEYEIIRDVNNNMLAVCNMENFDPLGIHTGESIVIAPSQTLDNKMYHNLRSICFKIVSHLNIIGECNIQFTIDPNSDKVYVIEMNPRLSRSSALASKATGYPLAYISAKVSLGYSLHKLINSVTKKTCAFFEPSLDYIVVKIPRWDLDKFPKVSTHLGTHMKSIGEVMAIGRNFREALQKAVRMVGNMGEFIPNSKKYLNSSKELQQFLIPNNLRIIHIFNILYYNLLSVDEIYTQTHITKWFLTQIKLIASEYKELETKSKSYTQLCYKELITKVKKSGFSDKQIGIATNKNEYIIRKYRYDNNIIPYVKQIDTVAGEFPCETNYLYLTYNAIENDKSIKEIRQNTISKNKVIVLGSGVYRIGSSVEFDWCAVSCVWQLRKLGIDSIIINNNPETVSTDYDEADKLYFEELSLETVYDIYNLEQKEGSLAGIILSMGGQISNNIAMDLYKLNVNILGTSPLMIDNAENRNKFSRLLDKIGVEQPIWKILTTLKDAINFCNYVNYPCLVRPSYVLSGAGMKVVYDDTQLLNYLENNTISVKNNIVISKFIENSREIDVDAVANKGKVVLLAISEHLENAGIHSGDATLILPPHDLNSNIIEQIKKITSKISYHLNISGSFNLQLIATDDNLKVIECNLRVSRSVPFASKTLGINMIDIATKIIVQDLIQDNELNIPKIITHSYVGVKVPQFSFHRLENTDVNLGVEMVSTGEVACFGINKNIAYLKALMATGFKIPNIKNCNLLISIGEEKFKEELLQSLELINNMGWRIYGTYGTSNYYNSKNIKVIYEQTIIEKIKNKQYNLIINISNRRLDKNNSLGYNIRRNSLDFRIPLITNIKCAKLFIESIYYYYDKCVKIDNNDIIYSN